MTYRISSEHAGLRLDRFLSDNTGETRARVQALISRGHVLLNGQPPAKNGVALRENDTVEIELPEPEPIDAFAQDIPLDVVYEDGALIVINKPRGMVVHPAAGNHDGTLVNALLHHCGDLSGIGGALRPGIVHRLDKQTTGLIVAAKSDAAHLSLSKQIKDRSAGRVYAALLLGSLKQERITVDAPIGRHKTDRKKMAVCPDGRPAITDFYVLEHLRSSTLAKCRLHTGRTHQIRVHAGSLGHPVMGDDVYGAGIKNDASVLMLHAYSLSFAHPLTHMPMSFTAEPPADFKAELSRFGWSQNPFWK